MRDEHECTAPGCSKMVSTRMLMCRHHWYRVPAHLRNAVWKTWNNGKVQEGYRAARQAAIDSLAPQPRAKASPFRKHGPLLGRLI